MFSYLFHTAAVRFIDFFLNIEWLNIAFIIAASIVLWWIARQVIRRFVHQFIKRQKYTSKKERKQRNDTLLSVFNTALTVIVAMIASALVLVQLGVDLAAAATGIGALGVVLGLAGQSLFKSIFRGLTIIMGNQARIGDIVEVVGAWGVVEDINLINVRIRDLDGALHIIPNGEIIVLTNHSLGFANVNLDIRVSYDSDMTKVAQIINRLGESMVAEEAWSGIIKTPIAFLRVDSFGESGVNIKALGEVIPGEQWATAGEFRRRLLSEFDKEGIEIPLPQRIVHTKV